MSYREHRARVALVNNAVFTSQDVSARVRPLTFAQWARIINNLKENSHGT